MRPPRRSARLRARIDTGIAHSWYFAPPATTSVEYFAVTDSTRAHGIVIVRNGLRTSIRLSLTYTTGRRVNAITSGAASDNADSAAQGVRPDPCSTASPAIQTPKASSSTPPKTPIGDRNARSAYASRTGG